MRVIMFKNIVVVAIAGFLVGCVATRNLLLEKGALPNDWHRVASTMVQLAGQSCIKITGYDSQRKEAWTKGRKLDTDWAVRRFYIGDNS